jgi:hypothetical protein
MPNDLHSLVPLAEFKAVLGIDDRKDCLDFTSMRNQGCEFSQSENSTHLFQPPSLAAYCLVTATYTIEQYCRRSLFAHRYFEQLEYTGDLLLTLREYPVQEILAVYALYHISEPELIEPELYGLLPEREPETEGENWSGFDFPHTLRLSPALGRLPGLTAFKAVYRAGYAPGKAPTDLASACLELAAWNMARYRGPPLRSRFFIGMTGNVRGAGKDGEHLEVSMPENIRLLLEPYRRKTI